MRGYKTYEKYKPSGEEWLGDIPEHWDVIKLKHICWRAANYGANEASDNYIQDGIRFLRTTDIDDFGRLTSENTVFIHSSAVSDYILDEGDILLSRSGTIGRSFLFSKKNHGQCAFASYLVRFSCKKEYLPKFVFYFTKSSSFFDWLGISVIQSTIGNVNGQKYANLPLSIPPIDEQKAIASFLDRHTTRIDTLITKKRQLIDLLQKKRDAIIYKAVTQGLNRDISFRDGGIEWLRKIPSHWKSVRLKFIAESIQTGPFGSQLHFSDYTPGGIPIINPSHLSKGEIFADPYVAVDRETWNRLSRHELLEGDIVLARRGELGRCGLVTSDEVGWLCGTGSMRVRLAKSRVLPAFIVQVLSTSGAAEQLALESVGSTMDNLNIKVLGDLLLPLPPMNEQKLTVLYLQEQNNYFQLLLEKTQTSIDEMSKYRAALITAAVTGKIDVREEVD